MELKMTPFSLTRNLLSFRTINPPGNERDCAYFCGNLLEEVGFTVKYYEFADNRTTAVAHLQGANTKSNI